MIRVAHLVGTAKPGGVETVVRNIATYLDRNELEMSVIVLGEDGPLSEELRQLGVEVQVVGEDGRGNLVATARMWRALRAGAFDIVHAHTGGRLNRLVTRASTNARIIAHVHGIPGSLADDFRFRRPAARAFLKKLTFGSDHVLTCSAWMTAAAGALLPEKSSMVTTLYGGVDLNRFAPGHATDFTSKDRGDSARRVTVGFIGRLVEQKGLPYLLEAASIVGKKRPSARFLVVGDGPMRSGIEEQLKSPAHSNVILTGALADIRPILYQCDITVMSSEWEPFGLTNIESMAMGVPVVAFDIDGIGEAVVNEETGLLVRHRDSAALADAIIRLIDDSALRSRLGMHGRAISRKLFDARDMVRSLESVYSRLVGS